MKERLSELLGKDLLTYIKAFLLTLFISVFPAVLVVLLAVAVDQSKSTSVSIILIGYMVYFAYLNGWINRVLNERKAEEEINEE